MSPASESGEMHVPPQMIELDGRFRVFEGRLISKLPTMDPLIKRKVHVPPS